MWWRGRKLAHLTHQIAYFLAAIKWEVKSIKSDVLLFDKPCSALDPLSSATVEGLIKGLKGRYAVLMVTHNLAQARRIADHVAMCWVQSGCGCIIESGDALTVLDNSIHPITQAFCQGLQG